MATASAKYTTTEKTKKITIKMKTPTKSSATTSSNRNQKRCKECGKYKK